MNWVVMPWYVNAGGIVVVPDLRGKTVQEAKKTLDSMDLQLEVAGTKSSNLPPNTVLTQNPEANDSVKHGRRIYVVVSGGVQLTVVPNLLGHSQREAQFMLERAGLVLGNVSSDSSSEFPQNVVMSQSIPAGTKVPQGTFVSVVISLGVVGPNEVSTPDVVGKPLSEAQRILTTAGLSVGKITFQPSSKLVPNTVLEQYPRPQEIVPKGTNVTLFVTSLASQSEN
ncbi:MAG: PASTA domain-containing protein [Candidatus Kryptoniota bacterium]